MGQGKQMKLLSYALVILLLSVSCSPVTMEELTAEPVEDNVSIEASVKASPDDTRSITVSFPLVSGATEYSVSAEDRGGNGLPEIMSGVSSSDYSNGLYHVTLSGLILGGKYSINVQAKNSANKAYVTVASLGYSLPSATPLDSDAPAISIVPSSDKTSIDVVFQSEAGFKYLVSLNSVSRARNSGHHEIVKGTGEDVSVSFDTEPTAVYDISVTYAYATVSDADLLSVSSETKTVETEVDLKTFDANLLIELDDESFIISGINEEAVSVSVGTADGKYRSVENTDIKDGKATISAAFLEPLQSGDFYAFAQYAEADKETRSRLSVEYIRPLGEVEVKENYQTAALSWTLGSGVELDKNKSSLTITDISGSKIASNKNPQGELSATGVKLSDLDSNTNYRLSIDLVTAEGGSYNFEKDITTKSFAGTYRWDNPIYDGSPINGPKNFVIDVSDGSARGNYHYTVSISKDDFDWDKTSHIIMPLIDSSETIKTHINPKSPGEYASENSAYMWNYKKWATIKGMEGLISYWYPSSTIKPNSNYKDYVCTYVTTSALLVGEVQTETTWTFRENSDGLPEIIFRNQGKMGIFELPEEYIEPGLDKYSFLLRPVSENGGV